MQCVNWAQLSAKQQSDVLSRPRAMADATFAAQVNDMIAAVKTGGDAALIQYAEQFDQVVLSELVVTAGEPVLPDDLRHAIDQAYDNIQAFHAAQLPQPLAVMTQPGVYCEKQYRPLQSVGLYVPGGSAPLLSTALMLAIPAQLVGCPEIVLMTPPNAAGGVHPAIEYIAKKCGITQIYLSGGAQAIAAMAYGTETVPSVDKIFGPGNRWVKQAKLQVAQDARGAMYDLPAGPSEVMVIADDAANPQWVAMDLLSQAEHGPDSQVILSCLSMEFAQQVEAAVEDFLQTLPRADIARQALQASRMIVVDDLAVAIDIANRYAPEHLILNMAAAEQWVARVQCAGSVFVGRWSPESVGDYASGTNHVLPTDGYARSVSGLGLLDFMLTLSVQRIEPWGLHALADTVECLAATEGLEAHRQAVALRRQALPDQTDGVPDDYALPAPRADIARMQGYSSAPLELNDAVQATEPDQRCHLNANENPTDVVLGMGSNRYPAPQPAALLRQFAELYVVTPTQVLLGRGSDEGIDVLLRAYCQAGRDAILVAAPSYGMYEVSAQIQGVDMQTVALSAPDFALKAADFLAAYRPSVKLVFICSPNNPVGNVISVEAVLTLCHALRGRALVVLDEAYVEFSRQGSLAQYLADTPNLVILRTVSKAWGLAGLRCGCVLAHPSVIAVLRKVLAPYPLPQPVVDTLTNALSHGQQAREQAAVAVLVAERDRLAAALDDMASVVRVWPSEANFLLVKVTDATALMTHCARHGVVIRDRSQMPGLGNCVRISVGSVSENDRLLAVMAEYEEV